MASLSESAISPTVLREALDQILACESCGEAADTPFYWVLDTIAGLDPTGSTRSDGLEAGDCPKCAALVGGDTLVVWN